MKTFLDIYESFSTHQKHTFKREVVASTGWSRSTFYYKLRENNLSRLERTAISSILRRFRRGDYEW